jgi:hypothetical protein
MRALLTLTCALLVSGCQPTPAPKPQNLDEAMKQLQSPIGHLGKASQTTVTVTATAVPSVTVTPTSISVGITTATPEPTPPYRLEATIRFDGEHLQIKATTDLPDGTLYRLGVQREIAVTPSPTSTLTGMMTHAGGFIPHDKVTLPEDGLPTSLDSFIAEAGRITGGEFIALVQMFPRYVQLLGGDEEPDHYTPNTKEVQVTFAVERHLPGQVKGLRWPEGTDRFVWRHTVPCALPDKAKAP